MSNLVRPETVNPPVSQVERLKQEVYTLGTSVRQVSGESGLSIDTVKSILAGNKVEQSTAARFEAYLKALARNEFHTARSLKRFDVGAMAGPGRRLERHYYALNKELWVEYKRTTLHPQASTNRRASQPTQTRRRGNVQPVRWLQHRPARRDRRPGDLDGRPLDRPERRGRGRRQGRDRGIRPGWPDGGDLRGTRQP